MNRWLWRSRWCKLDDAILQLVVDDAVIPLQESRILLEAAGERLQTTESESKVLWKVGGVVFPRPTNFVATILKADGVLEVLTDLIVR